MCLLERKLLERCLSTSYHDPLENYPVDPWWLICPLRACARHHILFEPIGSLICPHMCDRMNSPRIGLVLCSVLENALTNAHRYGHPTHPALHFTATLTPLPPEISLRVGREWGGL